MGLIPNKKLHWNGNQQFSSKKDACEEKSTGARNDYIISLAIANAHQDRYFNVDLDGCIRVKLN